MKRIRPLESAEKRKLYLKMSTIIIGLMFIVAALFLLKLPECIPILHDGPKQISIHSGIGVFLIPSLALVSNIILAIQNRLSAMSIVLYIAALLGMSFYYVTLI